MRTSYPKNHKVSFSWNFWKPGWLLKKKVWNLKKNRGGFLYPLKEPEPAVLTKSENRPILVWALSCSSCAVVVCLYQQRFFFLLSLCVSPALSPVASRCFCCRLGSKRSLLLSVVEEILLLLQVLLLPVVEEILHLCLFNCRIVLKNLLMIT